MPGLDLRHPTTWIVAFAVLAGAAVAVVLLVGDEVQEGARGPEAPATVLDVVTDPDDYVGRPLRVQSQVETVLGADGERERDGEVMPRVEGGSGFFTLGGDDPASRLLVWVPPQLSGPTITVGDALQVEGALQPYDAAELEQDFGVDTSGAGVRPGRLVLVATAIDDDAPPDGTVAPDTGPVDRIE